MKAAPNKGLLSSAVQMHKSPDWSWPGLAHLKSNACFVLEPGKRIADGACCRWRKCTEFPVQPVCGSLLLVLLLVCQATAEKKQSYNLRRAEVKQSVLKMESVHCSHSQRVLWFFWTIRRVSTLKRSKFQQHLYLQLTSWNASLSH